MPQGRIKQARRILQSHSVIESGRPMTPFDVDAELKQRNYSASESPAIVVIQDDQLRRRRIRFDQRAGLQAYVIIGSVCAMYRWKSARIRRVRICSANSFDAVPVVLRRGWPLVLRQSTNRKLSISNTDRICGSRGRHSSSTQLFQHNS